MIVDRDQVVRVCSFRNSAAGPAGAGRDTPQSC